MNATSRLLRWLVVLGVVAALAMGCGEEDQDPPPAVAGSTAESTSARGDASPEATATQPATTSASIATQSDASPDATVTQTDASPESTPSPGGTTTASMCPDGELPALGAMSITDGTVEWLECSSEEIFRNVLGASDDVVLIEENGPFDQSGTRSQQTIAFNATDGSELWRRSTAGTFTPSGPFDAQGIVVLADADAGALVGVDVLTGEERWSVESDAAPIANSLTVVVVWNEDDFSGGPLDTSKLRGIDRLTGDELWVSDEMLQDDSGNVVQRSPAAVLDEVLVFPTGATVTAIDMRTGAVLWEAPQLNDPVAADGTIVGTRGASGPPPMSPNVAAINAASGDELWTAPGLPSYGDLLAIGDGVIVVMDPGSPELVAYELSSGNERWRVAMTTRVQPELIDGTSLVMLWEGALKVLSTTDGSMIWEATEPFGSEWMNNVASNGESVFVAVNSRPFAD